MSRIAGIVGNSSFPGTNRILTAMLRSLDMPSFRQLIMEQERAGLGYAGLVPEQKISRVNHLLIVLDGQIYNNDELEKHTTDIGIIAHLYLKHGFENAVKQLNGDFSIALYDEQQKTLWLARDRFGLKPLYYYKWNDFFGFASRPKQLFYLPGATPEINKRYVAVYAAMHYRYFDNNMEESPYTHIYQLPPASLLNYREGKITISKYWRLTDTGDYNLEEKELSKKYRDLLVDAVRIRHRRFKNPAFTLSGGMDSSSILASCVHITNNKQSAFSTVYSDKTYDESDEISTILNSKVKHWYPIEVDHPDVAGLVKKMVSLHDEPVATATWLSHYILCRKVHELGFDALFGGLGGDELNAGEYEYFFYHFADLKTKNRAAILNNEIQKWIGYHNHPVFKKSTESVDEYFFRNIDFSKAGKIRPDQIRLFKYIDALNKDYYDLGAFDPVMEHPFGSYLKNRTYQDLTRETIPCCVRAEDRQTMAFGLENVLPFLDHRLVEFMFKVPGRYKIKDGVTKHLLREATKGIVPESTRTRIKKTGWNAPAHLWFSGKGRDMVMDVVLSEKFKSFGIYNISKLVSIIEEHNEIIRKEEVKENHAMLLWQVVNLDIWLNYFDDLKNEVRKHKDEQMLSV